jgi:hypothetical protein
MAIRSSTSLTARKDEVPAAVQLAITNVSGLSPFPGVGGLSQVTSG